MSRPRAANPGGEPASLGWSTAGGATGGRGYLALWAFGVRLGVSNLLRNGFSIGVQKTLGKILQPINSVSRYPEYAEFLRNILPILRSGGRLRLLDVGSPKFLGLYLAYHYDVEILLTDYSSEHLEEYVPLWDCLSERARGRVEFSAMDVRSLPLEENSRDLVYSMSVIEHVDTENGDRQAMREMFRVLAPGGRLVVSCPYGTQAVLQHRHGFAYNEEVRGRKQRFFFQKIYDREAWEGLVGAVTPRREPEMTVIRRRRVLLLRGFQKLGTQVRGILGALNPLMAWLCCEAAPYGNGDESGPDRYSDTVRTGDYYPDVVVSLVK